MLPIQRGLRLYLPRIIVMYIIRDIRNHRVVRVRPIIRITRRLIICTHNSIRCRYLLCVLVSVFDVSIGLIVVPC